MPMLRVVAEAITEAGAKAEARAELVDHLAKQDDEARRSADPEDYRFVINGLMLDTEDKAPPVPTYRYEVNGILPESWLNRPE
ncbi:hypothetical protein [Amycolatopsis sp. H20-H5]|uniref:hypothetical protein n=1 Tax=Amycolatopsis sp. H20-H5 TaxID=3046309 RepID=UPI002DBE8D91|nr:hypothetical protein [Amycolatopsis sp. H20-H5]MEC3977752.1 hypothetical protein [Amycolatopsis sp. H20-H5]